MAHQIQELINTANGHTLVLFTSYDQMGRVYEKLKDAFPVPVLQAQRNPQVYLESITAFSAANGTKAAETAMDKHYTLPKGWMPLF